MKNLDDISIFNNSSVVYSKKTSGAVILWMTILIVIFIIFCFISLFYKFSVSNIYYAKVVKNEKENYIYFDVDEEFISMKNRNYLQINDEEYKCHLISSSDKYYILNSNKYWNVTYECDLPEELNINDSLIEVQIEKRKTTLFNELIRKIRKEIKNGRIKS